MLNFARFRIGINLSETSPNIDTCLGCLALQKYSPIFKGGEKRIFRNKKASDIQMLKSILADYWSGQTADYPFYSV
jgi:hypothetical protein